MPLFMDVHHLDEVSMDAIAARSRCSGSCAPD
jgi:hypothetical protein